MDLEGLAVQRSPAFVLKRLSATAAIIVALIPAVRFLVVVIDMTPSVPMTFPT